MISLKTTTVKQTLHLSPILPTITELQTMEIQTTNRRKIKGPKVNKTSLRQKTRPTTLHQLLMVSRSLSTALHQMLILLKIAKTHLRNIIKEHVNLLLLVSIKTNSFLWYKYSINH